MSPAVGFLPGFAFRLCRLQLPRRDILHPFVRGLRRGYLPLCPWDIRRPVTDFTYQLRLTQPVLLTLLVK
ncbi:hypothetical protein QE436_001276 [Pantoea anthophila]|nr:hypothetical protein [Pantoea anthophila]